MTSKKQKYGYGTTDVEGSLTYSGKKSPPGIIKDGIKLFFTKGGMFCLKKGKSISPCRWGGNRLGRKHIREDFKLNPNKVWRWINK